MPGQTPQDPIPVRSPPPAHAHALHLTPTGDMPAGHTSSPRAPNAASTDVSSLLLPDHLRLTRENWAAYKHTIPVLCALRGVDDHLRNGRPEGSTAVPDQKWEDADALCKAIILFNIKDDSYFKRSPSVLARSDASKIWDGLVSMHERPMAMSSAELTAVIVGATTLFGMGCMTVFSKLKS